MPVYFICYIFDILFFYMDRGPDLACMDDTAGGDVRFHNCTVPDTCFFADTQTDIDRYAHADLREILHLHTACQHRAGGKIHTAADLYFMRDDRAGIDQCPKPDRAFCPDITLGKDLNTIRDFAFSSTKAVGWISVGKVKFRARSFSKTSQRTL